MIHSTSFEEEAGTRLMIHLLRIFLAVRILGPEYLCFFFRVYQLILSLLSVNKTRGWSENRLPR